VEVWSGAWRRDAAEGGGGGFFFCGGGGGGGPSSEFGRRCVVAQATRLHRVRAWQTDPSCRNLPSVAGRSRNVLELAVLTGPVAISGAENGHRVAGVDHPKERVSEQWQSGSLARIRATGGFAAHRLCGEFRCRDHWFCIT